MTTAAKPRDENQSQRIIQQSIRNAGAGNGDLRALITAVEYLAAVSITHETRIEAMQHRVIAHEAEMLRRGSWLDHSPGWSCACLDRENERDSHDAACSHCGTLRPLPRPPAPVGVWSAKRIKWLCNCGADKDTNDPAVAACSYCGYARPPEATVLAEPAARVGKWRDGGVWWVCGCGTNTSHHTTGCHDCRYSRPPATVGEWREGGTWRCGCEAFTHNNVGKASDELCSTCGYVRPPAKPMSVFSTPSVTSDAVAIVRAMREAAQALLSAYPHLGPKWHAHIFNSALSVVDNTNQRILRDINPQLVTHIAATCPADTLAVCEYVAALETDLADFRAKYSTEYTRSVGLFGERDHALNTVDLLRAKLRACESTDADHAKLRGERDFAFRECESIRAKLETSERRAENSEAAATKNADEFRELREKLEAVTHERDVALAEHNAALAKFKQLKDIL